MARDRTAQPSFGWVRRRADGHDDDDWRPPSRRAIRRLSPCHQPRRPSRRPSIVARPGFFLKFVTLPAGCAGGRRAVREADRQRADAARRQWHPAARRDRAVQPAGAGPRAVRLRRGLVRAGVQPAHGTVVALDERARRRFAFTTPAARSSLQLRGESPLRYFNQAPRIRVAVGDRVICGAGSYSGLHGGDLRSRRCPHRGRRQDRSDIGSRLRGGRTGRHRRPPPARHSNVLGCGRRDA